jgi:hypothetical protein
LFAISEVPPPKEFIDVHPRTVGSDPPELQQLTHFLDGLATVAVDRLSSRLFQLGDLCAQELGVLPLVLEPGTQPCRKRRSIPQPQPIEQCVQSAVLRQSNSLIR